MRVFISYASEDRDDADRLYAALASEGFEAFFAHRDIAPTEAHHLEIARRIDAWADVVVCLVTAHWLDASYTHSELGLAKGRWKRGPQGRVLAYVMRDRGGVPERLDAYLREHSLPEHRGDLCADVLRDLRRLRGRSVQRLVDVWRKRVWRLFLGAAVVALAVAGWGHAQRQEARLGLRTVAALSGLEGYRVRLRDQVDLGMLVVKDKGGDDWRNAKPLVKDAQAFTQWPRRERALGTVDPEGRERLVRAGLASPGDQPWTLHLVELDDASRLREAIEGAARDHPEGPGGAWRDRELRLVSSLLELRRPPEPTRVIGYLLSKLCWDAAGRLLPPKPDVPGTDECPGAPVR